MKGVRIKNIHVLLGYREKAILDNLAYSYAEKAPSDYRVVVFVSRDKSRFSVVSRDRGRTWTVCG